MSRTKHELLMSCGRWSIDRSGSTDMTPRLAAGMPENQREFDHAKCLLVAVSRPRIQPNFVGSNVRYW